MDKEPHDPNKNTFLIPGMPLKFKEQLSFDYNKTTLLLPNMLLTTPLNEERCFKNYKLKES